MISQTAEYALRAMVFLAMHRGEPSTVETIGRSTRIPAGYLAKIMQHLSRAGFTTAQRGLHGGFLLVRDPADITLLDVFQAVDPVQRIRTCPQNDPNLQLCGLHRTLELAVEAGEAILRGASLATIISEPTHVPLCSVGELPTLTKVGL